MATSILGLNTAEVTAATEILGPGSSMYTILRRNILKTYSIYGFRTYYVILLKTEPG